MDDQGLLDVLVAAAAAVTDALADLADWGLAGTREGQYRSDLAADAAERRLNIVARSPVSLTRILAGEEMMCEVFDRCLAVSRYLLDSAGSWLG